MRLSEEAKRLLALLAQKLSISQAAVMELAVRDYAKQEGMSFAYHIDILQSQLYSWQSAASGSLRSIVALGSEKEQAYMAEMGIQGWELVSVVNCHYDENNGTEYDRAYYWKRLRPDVVCEKDGEGAL